MAVARKLLEEKGTWGKKMPNPRKGEKSGL